MQLAEGIEEFLAYLLVELNRSPKTVSGYRKDYRVLQRFLEERVRLLWKGSPRKCWANTWFTWAKTCTTRRTP